MPNFLSVQIRYWYLGCRYRRLFFTEALRWGGSAGRSGFAGLSAKGLGGASSVTTSVSGFERPLFGCDLVVDRRYRHRYRRCRPSVSSVSAIGSGIVDIRYRYRYRLLHASRSSRSFFTETLGWGGSAGRSGFASLSAQGLGSASAGRSTSVSALAESHIGIIDIRFRYRRYPLLGSVSLMSHIA